MNLENEDGFMDRLRSSKLSFGKGRYVGVDPSSFLINRAKEIYSTLGHEFVVGDIYALQFAAGSFDAIISIAVWHLLEQSQKAAFEISRVLDSSGSILLIMADPSQYDAWTEQYELKSFNGIRFEGTNKRSDGSTVSDVLFLRSKDEILMDLEKAKIKITDVKTFRNQIAIQGKKI